MIVLTIDLGTSATKAALWSEGSLSAFVRVALTTTHPAPGHAEQDAHEWWSSTVAAW